MAPIWRVGGDNCADIDYRGLRRRRFNADGNDDGTDGTDGNDGTRCNDGARCANGNDGGTGGSHGNAHAGATAIHTDGPRHGDGYAVCGQGSGGDQATCGVHFA